ncbi:hypothetical protein R3X52_17110, partial [Acinetobacter baumannii]|nr:hypothetical protein [Acinetobacter baumannii]
MKILHIANFGFNKQGAHFYCTDRKISAGLIENGHFVYDFSSVHDKFHRTLILSGFCLLKIAKISL